MEEVSAVRWPRSCGLFVVIVLIGICSREGVRDDETPGSKGPVVSSSSSSSSSATLVCGMRGVRSSTGSDIAKYIFENIYFFTKTIMAALSGTYRPTYENKTSNALKADKDSHRVTFNPNKTSPGETLYVSVPKLDDGVVLVPGSLALVFNLGVSGQAKNFLVNNASRALVSQLVVKFAGEKLQETKECDIYKLYEDLLLPKVQRANMFLKGIQSEDLCKIRLNAGDKKTSGVDTEKKLEAVYKNKYRIALDHEILKNRRASL